MEKDAVFEVDIEECTKLFSTHYGVWSEVGFRPGESVKCSVKRFKQEYLFDKNTFIVKAINSSGTLVGHAVVVRFYFEAGGGYITWITQLVVDPAFRNQKIGTRLCLLAWNPMESYACCIVTSHP